MNELQQKKSKFVEKLSKFYLKNVEDGAFNCLQYRITENGDEWVYVIYGATYKRFCVTGDNEKGMFVDFMRFMENAVEYEWHY